MYQSTTVAFYLLALSIPFSSGEPHIARRHSKWALSSEGDPALRKRENQRMSFYAPGIGACGANNGPNDYIVSLNKETYDAGSYCGQVITISYGGKTAQATIQDRCEDCGQGGIDLTPGLFSFFASPDAGIIYGDWHFGSGQTSSSTPSRTTAASTASKTFSVTASSSSSSPVPSPASYSTSAVNTQSTPGPASTSATSSNGSLEAFNQAVLGIGYLISWT